MTVGSRAKPKTPPVPPGTYLARCIGVVDMGEQEIRDPKRNRTSYVDKVRLVFELPTERIQVDGQDLPRQLSTEFTFTSSPKGNLYKFVSNWLNKTYQDGEFSEFELYDLIGRPAMLGVGNSKDGQYSNITGAMAVPSGVTVPEAETPEIRFDINKWDDDVFQSLSEYFQDRLKHSTQYRDKHLPDQEVSVEAAATEAAETASAEEVPF